jgi:hypothetical protein
MSSPLRWPDAALAGFASSMRTFAGPGMLAARGRITGPARVAVLLAATGELAMDKTSAATDRTDPPAVAGRVAAGAYTGRTLAGGAGIVAGAAGAAVGSYASWRARKLVVDTTGLPDPVIAVGEDMLAMGVAAIATRPDPEPRPEDPSPPSAPQRSLWRSASAGLAAGLAGTAVMTIAQGAEFVLTDAEPSSSPARIADRIKRATGQGRLKRRHRRAANQGMHWLYGASWGVPYGLLVGSRDVSPEVSGPVFGLLVWGAALAHEPALGLADVPWKRSLSSLGSEALFHLVYGIGAGGAMRALQGPRR